MKRFLLSFIVLIGLSGPVLGQNEDGNILDGSVVDLSIVAGAGIGGAVLGLSTLSFEEKPKEHLRHILVGGSLGIIVGVALVAWSQASKSKEIYDQSATTAFNSGGAQIKLSGAKMRVNWHEQIFNEYWNSGKIKSSFASNGQLFYYRSWDF